MTTIIETQLKDIEQLLKEMVTLVSVMHQDAMKAFQLKDPKLALEVIKRDELVNNLDELINETVLSFLATQSPVGIDLRSALAIVRIANDVERIGDYAKSISEFIILGKPLYQPFESSIIEMSTLFHEMFISATNLFYKPVLEETYQIANKDQLIDAKLKKAFHEIPKVTTNDNVLSLLDTFNIIRTIERAGDHTKNICEAIIFKLKGKKIDLG